MDKEKLISYWIGSSDRDFKAMKDLFEKGHFTWSLFVGHLVIERLLKAYYVKKIDTHPPLIHDLLRIAEISRLELTDEQQDWLDTISAFNIKARYDDVKLKFYRKCSRDFAELWIDRISRTRKWIKNQLL